VLGYSEKPGCECKNKSPTAPAVTRAEMERLRKGQATRNPALTAATP
jgi:hypothetical protein